MHDTPTAGRRRALTADGYAAGAGDAADLIDAKARTFEATADVYAVKPNPSYGDVARRNDAARTAEVLRALALEARALTGGVPGV